MRASNKLYITYTAIIINLTAVYLLLFPYTALKIKLSLIQYF